ncbi:hypothetical protein LJC55_00395 [Eubacteriales bacterium OttesenSCG-928-N14]|nr:hypothetical protein [Eubacteriales bacterium OttesenSCG-928-N14]
MKRILLLVLCMGLALAACACGGGGAASGTVERPGMYSESKDIVNRKIRVWTEATLAEQGEGDSFVPTDPQPDRFILVMGENNRNNNKATDLNDHDRVQNDGSLIAYTLTRLAYLDDADTANTMKSYVNAMQTLNMDAVPLMATDDPNQARIKLVFEYTYPTSKKYTPVDSRGVAISGAAKVDVYSCRITITAYDMTTGKMLGTPFMYTNNPGNSINTSGSTHYMSRPGLTNDEAASQMLEYFQTVAAALPQ